MRTAVKMMLLLSGKKPDKKKNCIKACQECSAACDSAIQYVKQHPEGFPQQLINLLNDCHSYTKLMAEFIERDSEFSKLVYEVGKSICERCKEECAKHPDVAELGKVIQECVKCIAACGAYLS
jgi:hypothetical protein